MWTYYQKICCILGNQMIENILWAKSAPVVLFKLQIVAENITLKFSIKVKMKRHPYYEAN